VTLNITDQQIYAGLIDFLNLFIPAGTPIIQGQQNRVPMPNTPFVLMTTLGAPERIGTNFDSTTPVTNTAGKIVSYAATVSADYQYRVQLDMYSPNAESWAMTAELLWRDSIGISAMPDGMAPLYSEDQRQMPLAPGNEDQYVQRWTMTLVIDYQPTWVQPTDAATFVNIIPEPVDIFFAPEWTSDSDTPSDSDKTT